MKRDGGSRSKKKNLNFTSLDYKEKNTLWALLANKIIPQTPTPENIFRIYIRCNSSS